MKGDQKQIFITADALVSSLGFGTQENLEGIRSYHSGVTVQTDGRISDSPLLAATLDAARFQKETASARLEGYTRLEQLFILCIQQIIEQTGVSPAHADCRLLLATTKGNIDLLNGQTVELNGQTVELNEQVFISTMSERIGSYFRASHRAEVISNACISGVSTLIIGKRLIESGACKHVIVAGGDVLSHFITSGFQAFKSLSKEMGRPYDSRRDGLNLGEACGAVLLSSEESPHSIVFSGGAISNDANHISGPSRTGDGLYYAIRQAMEEASIRTEDISFINAHGTATVFNDEMEAKAIHLAGLQDVPVQSLKSYFGHTLGAAGVVELIICLHELKEGILFGTLGYEEPGVPVPIIVQPFHQRISMKSCIKTASGFGGCNAAIVLALPGSLQRETLEIPPRISVALPSTPAITTTVEIEDSRVCLNGAVIFRSSANEFAPFIREAFKNLYESNPKFYKMSDLCKLGYVAAGYLLQGRNFLPREIGIILSNASASLDSDIQHQEDIDRSGDGAASPATFVYTLPNTVAGEICIRHKIQGESTFFIEPEYDEEKQYQYALTVMQKGGMKACIIGWCELLGNQYKAVFKLIEIESWKN